MNQTYATIQTMINSLEELVNWIQNNCDVSDHNYPTFILDRAEIAIQIGTTSKQILENI